MSLSVPFLAVSVVARVVIAANNTVATTVGWMPDPNGRGTFSLVLSSVLTLGLCVWSAMHLNIPPHNASPLHIWIRSFLWGLTGIFAPELVVFAAWRQYNSAKELHVQVNSQIKRSSQIGKAAEVRHPWTMVQSFYAGMGGFVLELDPDFDEQSQRFIPGDQHLTLSARGVALLALCGHVPNINEDDIVDKSKSDSLAKSLVCVQASWMVVQVIGRLILGLPITLLEVNILGHVLCALIIYLLWWHKPRLVHEPTMLRGDWVKPLCAYMFLSSQISGSKRNPAGALWQAWLQPEVMSLAFFTSKSASESDKPKEQTGAPNIQKIPTHQSQSSLGTSSMEDYGINKLSTATKNPPSTYFGPRPPPQGPADTYKFSDRTEQAVKPTSMQLERWKLAADAVQNHPALTSRLQSRHEMATHDWFEVTPEELVTRGATNWPAEDLLRGTQGLVMGIALWCASMAYGAIHIAAWHDYFPTILEQWLWRSSAIYITFSGALWLLVNLFAHEWKALDAYWDRVLRRQAHWTSYAVLGSLCTVCGIAYIFARLFLVVEAFLSIRRLPIAAYQTPDWTKFIPHL